MRSPREDFAAELTPIGEQLVIPGCERDKRSGPAQLNLWGSAPPKSRTSDNVPEQALLRD